MALSKPPIRRLAYPEFNLKFANQYESSGLEIPLARPLRKLQSVQRRGPMGPRPGKLTCEQQAPAAALLCDLQNHERVRYGCRARARIIRSGSSRSFEVGGHC